LACLWDGYWNSLQQEDLYAGPGKLTLICLKGNVLVLNTWFYDFIKYHLIYVQETGS